MEWKLSVSYPAIHRAAVLIVPCGMETFQSKAEDKMLVCINCTLWNGNNFGSSLYFKNKCVLIVPCGMET